MIIIIAMAIHVMIIMITNNNVIIGVNTTVYNTWFKSDEVTEEEVTEITVNDEVIIIDGVTVNDEVISDETIKDDISDSSVSESQLVYCGQILLHV
jgi:hypothetical protein